jgi:hypothetical protein
VGALNDREDACGITDSWAGVMGSPAARPNSSITSRPESASAFEL